MFAAKVATETKAATGSTSNLVQRSRRLVNRSRSIGLGEPLVHDRAVGNESTLSKSAEHPAESTARSARCESKASQVAQRALRPSLDFTRRHISWPEPIGAVDNPSGEHEADRVAEQVIRTPDPEQTLIKEEWSPVYDVAANTQPTLAIGSVDDPLEQEADRAADKVMRMPDPDLLLTTSQAQLSRKCAACEEEEEGPVLQAKSAGPAADVAPAIVHEALRSPGQPLGSKTRAFFEPRFRHDFSDVQIHADPPASDSARTINALGYTVGRHIVFAHGQYSPATDSGRHLLAHELAHVIQQAPSMATGLETHAVAATPRDQSALRETGTERLIAGVVRRQTDSTGTGTGAPQLPWDPYTGISAGIGRSLGAACIATTDAAGDDLVCGNLPGEALFKCISGATYTSVCPFPCVGQPLSLRPLFWVDGPPTNIRPLPFDPATLSATIFFYPDTGLPDVVLKETSTGQYAGPGVPLNTGFPADLTFYTPDSAGTLMVSLGIADPTSGVTAVYSDRIPVIQCPTGEAEQPAVPSGPVGPLDYIQVPDPVNAPLQYQRADYNSPPPLFPVWHDQAGNNYYMFNGQRVDLPNPL